MNQSNFLFQSQDESQVLICRYEPTLCEIIDEDEDCLIQQECTPILVIGMRPPYYPRQVTVLVNRKNGLMMSFTPSRVLGIPPHLWARDQRILHQVLGYGSSTVIPVATDIQKLQRLTSSLYSFRVQRPICNYWETDFSVFLNDYGQEFGPPVLSTLQASKLKSTIAHIGCDSPKSALPKSTKKKRHPIGTSMRRSILERDKYQCVDCGRSPRNDPECVLHIDHRIAVANGGGNNPENLQTLCDLCNLGKGVKDDWKLQLSS